MIGVRISDIKSALADHYQIEVADLDCAARTADAVQRRAIGYKLSVELTRQSRSEIGRRFGGRDHATVLNGLSYFDNKATLEMRATYHRLHELIIERSAHTREIVWAFPFKSRRSTAAPSPKFLRSNAS